MVNNLCRNKPSVEFYKIRDAIPYLVDSLKTSDSDILIENLWACAYISDIGDDAMKALVESDVMS